MAREFDRRGYMRAYMAARRAAKRPRPLAPPDERRDKWEARAQEMRAIARDMKAGAPRAMLEKLAKDYEWLAEQVDA